MRSNTEGWKKKEYWRPNRALCLAAKSLMQLVMIVKLLWIVNRESTWCTANEKFDFAPSDNTGTTYMTQLIKVKTFRKWKKIKLNSIRRQWLQSLEGDCFDTSIVPQLESLKCSTTNKPVFPLWKSLVVESHNYLTSPI